MASFAWRGTGAGEDAPHLSLCGKGVCFDSGGYDLKPSAAMLRMKKDMGGAANVLALAQMVMDAKLKVRLRVLIPAVENAVAGNAFRPLDIFKSRKGITVEIGNTDAEGRLVLADALALADEETPDLLVDLGTLTGAVLAFALNFFAAQNTSPGPWVRFVVRRLLEFARTVPGIVFALIFVIAFGLGPMAGVLAIAIHTTGALGKLFAEIVENADMKPVEGIRSTGASWLSCMRFAILPQVSAGYASYALLRFEINVREASVMGFVGAGGIGQELVVAIRKFYYSDVSAILVTIIVTVFIIDISTGWLRGRLFGKETRR